MIRYKLITRVRYVTAERTSIDSGRWVISLEGVGSLGMSEKPEFKSGDEINIVLEGPVDARSNEAPIV